MLHRTRDLLMRQRTQLINALRAHMAELGIMAAQGRERLCLWSSDFWLPWTLISQDSVEDGQ
jgi:transposase